jgi:hypothetical protein
MFHPMMRWAPASGLQKRRILASSIMLAVLACAALPGVSEASRKLRGVGFSTIVPGTWKTGKGAVGGTHIYRAASAKTKPNVTVNSMQLSVTVMPAKDLERQLGRKLPSSLEALLGMVVSAPQSAQGVQFVVPIRSSSLAGVPAASSAAQYIYNGATVVQSDTICVRRGRVYIVEFNYDLNLEYQGLPILGRTHSHWRWR